MTIKNPQIKFKLINLIVSFYEKKTPAFFKLAIIWNENRIEKIKISNQEIIGKSNYHLSENFYYAGEYLYELL